MPQANGETLVAFPRCTLTLNSDLAELDRLRDFVDRFCGVPEISEETSFHVSVALEELFINSVTHGHCDPPERAICLTMRIEDGRLIMTYSDNGRPFDLLSVAEPNFAESLGERRIGGLGVHFVRCLMTEIRYERRDGRNWLCLAKCIGNAADSGRTEGSAHADCDGDRAR